MSRDGNHSDPAARATVDGTEIDTVAARDALSELKRAAAAVESVRQDQDAALEERDAAIARAARAGLTRRRIAGVVGLSAARVQQICDGFGAD